MRLHLNTRRGFSLVELCVCIGIILVLLGILLPAVAHVRRESRTAICGSNLSQIGRGLFAYAGENRGFLPRAPVNIPTDWVDPYFLNAALPYPSFVPKLIEAFKLGNEKSRRLLICPNHESEGVTTSYVINGVGITNENDFITLYAMRPASATEISRVRKAADVPYVMDGSDYFDEGRFGTDFDIDSVYSSESHFVSCNGHLLGQINQRIADSRHGRGKINVLFFDGSVRRIESKTIDMHMLDDGVRGRLHPYIGWQLVLPDPSFDISIIPAQSSD